MRNFIILFFVGFCFISCTESERYGMLISSQDFEPEFYGCADHGIRKKNQSAEITNQEEVVTAHSVYGADNRRDWFESSDRIKNRWAKSTLALIENTKIQKMDNGSFKINAKTYGQKNDLCPEVPFIDQPTPALCSGFLIHDDLVMTAGHCLNNTFQCKKTYLVFDFAKFREDQKEYMIPASSVYECEEIVIREMGWDDFAVIRLNRPVKDRSPLSFRRQGSASVGEELTLIGHPGGLPSKITEGFVKEAGSRMFANIDASSGSSGSPVINTRTGAVEGVLVSGVEDYKSQGSCKVEYLCGPDDHDCKGELITPTSRILAQIPQLCSL